MSTTTLTPRPHGEQPLDAALRAIHAAWLREARRFLEPALVHDADFWTRWAAVRYLTDDFRERYRLERAFLDELRPFLDPETVGQLGRGGDHVFRLRLELDRLGRRRGTAAEMLTGTRRLLEQLVVWLAEIELAAGGLTRESLPPEGADLLAHLEAERPVST